MKIIVYAVALIVIATGSHAADLFKDGKPAEYVKDSVLIPGSTVGGYPIFKGDGEWRLRDISSSSITPTGGSIADAVGQGFASFSQNEPDGNWFASMFLSVSTKPSGGNIYSTGSPCGGIHIVAVNKVGGRDDNCLTIDAANFQSGPKFVTYFNVVLTQSRSGGRRYIMALNLNAELLGFRETAPAEWNDAYALKSSPSRTAFILKIKKWAELLQSGTESILDYSNPQNVFDGVPSYRTLLTVPSDLSDGSFPQQFIGAVESTRYKPNFRAIAYTKLSPGRVRWSNEYAKETQEVAEKMALENCEKGRTTSMERCKLYDLDKVIASVSPKATSSQVGAVRD